MARFLSSITRIGQQFLNRQDCSGSNSIVTMLKRASIAERMSWASLRRTTRAEDRAYSLRIFNINMSLLYGEGLKAFIRLQEEIARHSDDQCLLGTVMKISTLLAKPKIRKSRPVASLLNSRKPLKNREILSHVSQKNTVVDSPSTILGCKLPFLEYPFLGGIHATRYSNVE